MAKSKSLKDWFLERNKEHPELGAYINLCYTIHHSGASRQELTKAFNELIPKDEYDKSEKKELIDYLVLKAGEETREVLKEKRIMNQGRVLYQNTSL